MSNNRVLPENLSKAIQEYLKDYKEDIEDEVIELSNKYIKEARNELKSISPKAKKVVKLKGGESQMPRRLRKVLVY